MPMTDEVVAQIESVHLFAREESIRIAENNHTIVSIALAGAWAMGIPSPVDVDLILLFEKYSDIGRFSWDNNIISRDYSLDLHRLSCRQMENHMFSRKSNLKSVKSARLATRKLRSYPGVKKVLLKILRHHVGFLKLREVTPQAQQILIPLVDRNNYFSNLQQKQKAVIVAELSECEKILYQSGGFYQLLEAYLTGRFTMQELKPALCDFYGDSKAFLQRIIQCYESDSAKKIIALYHYIYGDAAQQV
ncbi:MAG: hypothetical protein JRJ68_13810 [Deltaproteobacteria bacterium]|nr:hypothetical protein [Deltaproteobacteria bacterium]